MRLHGCVRGFGVRAGWDREELWGTADDFRHWYRGIFDAGRWILHARCKDRLALWRGTSVLIFRGADWRATNNLAAAVGTAVAGGLLVDLLSAVVLWTIAENWAQHDLTSINFISDRLKTVMETTTASPAQVAKAVRVNTDSRLRALKIGLLIMAGIFDVGDFPGRATSEFRSRRAT